MRVRTPRRIAQCLCAVGLLPSYLTLSRIIHVHLHKRLPTRYLSRPRAVDNAARLVRLMGVVQSRRGMSICFV